jgi:hypothetical protein
MRSMVMPSMRGRRAVDDVLCSSHQAGDPGAGNGWAALVMDA